MGKTGIAWTEETWNPTRGCSIKSPGCKNCYAMAVAGARLAYPATDATDDKPAKAAGPYFGLVALHGDKWVWTGEVRLIRERLAEPIRKTKPTMFFVNSMSDLFHHELTDDSIDAVLGAILASPEHTFQALTKRLDRAAEYFARLGELPDHEIGARLLNALSAALPDDTPKTVRAKIEEARKAPVWPLRNLWFGPSIEDQKRADERLPLLNAIRPHVSVVMVSAEPLLERVDFEPWLRASYCTSCDHYTPGKAERCRVCDDTASMRYPRTPIDWIIPGGESGDGHRPMEVSWVEAIVFAANAHPYREPDEHAARVFVKQLGGPVGAKQDNPSKWPPTIRVRQWPDEERARLKAWRSRPEGKPAPRPKVHPSVARELGFTSFPFGAEE